MYEKRMTARLRQYWDTLRKDAPIPHFAQFNQGAIDDLWPKCLVLVAQPTASGKVSFRVQTVGHDLVEIFGNDLIGREATRPALRAFGGGKIAGRIEELSATRTPLDDEGKYVNDKNKIVKYRACLLPFAADEEGLSHVIAGLSWREF